VVPYVVRYVRFLALCHGLSSTTLLPVCGALFGEGNSHRGEANFCNTDKIRERRGLEVESLLVSSLHCY
jgi:hypothetical protein